MRTLLIAVFVLFPLSVGADNGFTIPEGSYIISMDSECIGDCEYEEVKSQEWLEKCDEYLIKMRSGTCDANDWDCTKYNSNDLANIATAYCTRALLEEMKK